MQNYSLRFFLIDRILKFCVLHSYIFYGEIEFRTVVQSNKRNTMTKYYESLKNIEIGFQSYLKKIKIKESQITQKI